MSRMQKTETDLNGIWFGLNGILAITVKHRRRKTAVKLWQLQSIIVTPENVSLSETAVNVRVVLPVQDQKASSSFALTSSWHARPLQMLKTNPKCDIYRNKRPLKMQPAFFLWQSGPIHFSTVSSIHSVSGFTPLHTVTAPHSTDPSCFHWAHFSMLTSISEQRLNLANGWGSWSDK